MIAVILPDEVEHEEVLQASTKDLSVVKYPQVGHVRSTVERKRPETLKGAEASASFLLRRKRRNNRGKSST